MKMLLGVLAAGALLVAGCSSEVSTSDAAGEPAADEGGATSQQRFPDVLAAELTPESAGSYSVAVTISSPYDTPQRYADGWRVLTPEGTELGKHTLGHDHASEQPFTRTQTGLQVPAEVTEVVVEGRDQQYGYGGDTVTVAVPPPDVAG